MDRAMTKRSVSSMVGGVPLLTIGGCGAQSGSDGRTDEVMGLAGLVVLGTRLKS